MSDDIDTLAVNALRGCLTPGILDGMAAVTYHADPCPQPSLSSSIAKLLCLQSPKHAWAAHPRLNPQAVQQEEERFDVGTAAHALILEGASNIEIVQADDWRTKAAKEQRDAARAAGKTPLLAKKWADVQAMAQSIVGQLAEHTDGGQDMFKNGKPEQVLVWQEESGVWCRARLDWLRPGAVDDLKTTPNANPEVCSRTLFGNGYDISAAFYLRGLKRLTGEDAVFRFAFIETTQPHALSVVGLTAGAMMLAERKVRYALDLWKTCLDNNEWPGYEGKTAWAEAPPWSEAAWMAKEDRELGL